MTDPQAFLDELPEALRWCIKRGGAPWLASSLVKDVQRYWRDERGALLESVETEASSLAAEAQDLGDVMLGDWGALVARFEKEGRALLELAEALPCPDPPRCDRGTRFFDHNNEDHSTRSDCHLLVFQRAGGAALFAPGTDLRRDVLRWARDGRKRIEAFIADPLEAPPWQVLGRPPARSPLADATGSTWHGLWDASRAPFNRWHGPKGRECQYPPTMEQELAWLTAAGCPQVPRLHANVFSVVAVWMQHAWIACLGSAPWTNRLVDFHVRVARSSWTAARVLDCVVGPQWCAPEGAPAAELGDEVKRWAAAAWEQVRVWAISRDITDAQSVPFPSFDEHQWASHQRLLKHAGDAFPNVEPPLAVLAMFALERLAATHSDRNDRGCGPVNGSTDRPRANSIRRAGKRWELVFDGKAVSVGHRVAIVYLIELLRQPGRTIDASQFAAVATLWSHDRERWNMRITDAFNPDDVTVAATSQPTYDKTALSGIRRNLEETELKLEEARSAHDAELVETLEKHHGEVQKILNGATYRGKARPISNKQKAARRAAVLALNRALDYIVECHPELGEHLSSSLTVGAACRYAPAPPVHWFF